MNRATIYLFLFFSLLLAGIPATHAAKRVALVIGNSAYEHASPLKNPKNDADAISGKLETLGFDVVKGIDLKHRDFAGIIRAFRDKLSGADVALFFYAGHGLQVDGKNFLAPVDAMLEDRTSLEFEAVTLNAVLRLMEAEERTNLVFLDACRDNPLARNLARGMGTRSNAVGRGLARVESGIGTMIAFATQPGNVALDGEGKNSPFTSALLKHIDTPGLDVADLMRRVRLDVLNSTSRRQVPWNHSSLTGAFHFKDKPRTEQVDLELVEETAFWNSVKIGGTRAQYEAYLERYPQGRFAGEAGFKIASLTKAAEDEARLRAAQEAKRKIEAAEHLKKAEDERKRIEDELAAERARIAAEREEFAAKLKVLQEQAKARAKQAVEKDQKQTVAVLPSQDKAKVEAKVEELVEKDPKVLALILQNELKRVGCDPGNPDGVWGHKGRAALTRFNTHAKLVLPVQEPTQAAIDAVKTKVARVCPAPVAQPNTVRVRKPVSPKQKTAIVKPKRKKSCQMEVRCSVTRGCGNTLVCK